jgi:hypothetical protein
LQQAKKTRTHEQPSIYLRMKKSANHEVAKDKKQKKWKIFHCCSSSFFTNDTHTQPTTWLQKDTTTPLFLIYEQRIILAHLCLLLLYNSSKEAKQTYLTSITPTYLLCFTYY